MASSKPIQEQIYKSRLTITYRTTITGTLKEETLPFRLLVLGGFAGQSLRGANLLEPLSERHVRTIKRGRSVDDHLREMIPVWRISDSRLQSKIPGKATIEHIEVTVPAVVTSQPKVVPIKGKVFFNSTIKQNGFADFDGQELDAIGSVEISKDPNAGLQWGKVIVSIRDVAYGDRLDPATRAPSGKVVGIAESIIIGKDDNEKKNGIAIDPTKWVIDLIEEPDDGSGGGKPKPTNYKLTPPGDLGEYDVELERAVPITSMASFNPDRLMEAIPEIERVRLLKRLLLRLQSTLRNRPELRSTIRSILAKKEIDKFKALQKWVLINFPILKLNPAPSTDKLTDPEQNDLKALQDELLAPIASTSTDLFPPPDTGSTQPAEPWAIVRPVPNADGTPGALTAPLKFEDRETKFPEAAWLMNGLAVFLANIEEASAETRRLERLKPDPANAISRSLADYPELLNSVTALLAVVDRRMSEYLDEVYHDPEFQELEALWRGLDNMASGVENEDVYIDFLDVGQDELHNDIVDHDLDMFSGEIFNKIYVGEYDRYGGKPFASMIGLYAYGSNAEDIRFLRAMGRVANAAHCPFIASASQDFFAPYKTMEDVAAISDLDAVLAEPQFGKWQELRDTEYAAYLGLTLPRYLVRLPWKPELYGNDTGYRETVPFSRVATPDELDGDLNDADLKENLLWGHASVLFAKNMIASYQGSGWAQYIRGPRGGGLCEGLVSYKYTKNGYEEIQPPVEVAIPDYRELQFANNGFIPLVHKKGEAVATFFSAQSLKKSKKFVEDLATKNAALVTNLAYTYSITRIAHYVKRMMREYIGAAADGAYIQKVLAAWLGQYVTIVSNPDDLTLRYYPFKAATVDVMPKPGPLGWYKATIKILPHIQFEGMDVELQLEAALGGP